MAAGTLDKISYNVGHAIEAPFRALQLDTFVDRFAVGAIVPAVILLSLSPRICFNEDGSARPWALTDSSGDAVWVPWWGYSLAGALYCAFLV